MESVRPGSRLLHRTLIGSPAGCGRAMERAMQTDSQLKRYRHIVLASILLAGLPAAASAQETPGLPPYMGPIAGRTSTSATEIATNNVLALNTMMFELYGDAAQIFKKNILS